MLCLTSTEQSFIEILRVAVGSSKYLNKSLDVNEWNEIKLLSVKHALAGVVFGAIQRLSHSSNCVLPDKKNIIELYSISESYKKRNIEQVNDIVLLSRFLSDRNFDSCIIKGQALSLYYPSDIVRTPGDIDIWVMHKDDVLKDLNSRRHKIIDLCHEFVGFRRVFYHHTDFPIKGRDIEIHFTPSWMFSPWHNARLQKFYEREWQHKRLVANFYSPSPEMDTIHILLHIYRHLFDEGIGLRQVIDYYFVLKNSVVDKERVLCVMKSIGLIKFAGAMMWILHEVLNMPEEYMLCPANKNRGKQLLNEIMQAGNFGKYDERLASINRNSLFSRLKQNIDRNFRLMRNYPSEAFCSPFWKMWQKIWQFYNGYGAMPSK